MIGVKVGSARSVDEKLALLLGWPGWRGAELSWNAAESTTKLQFPDDFKGLLGRFPSGVYAEYFHVFSPVQSTVTLERFQYYLNENIEYLRRERERHPENIPYKLYPEAGGLVPWGFGAEHIHCWNTAVSSVSNEWTVVYYNHEYGHGEYQGGMCSFMLDVIKGSFADEELYYDMDEESWNFGQYEEGAWP
jgi:hypothetical protein